MLFKFEARMTDRIMVPAETPDWFDPGYAMPSRLPIWPTPDDIPISKPRPRLRHGELANVLVLSCSPQYPSMVERTKDESPAFWRVDLQQRGIWVARGWLEAAAAGPKNLAAFAKANERFARQTMQARKVDTAA